MDLDIAETLRDTAIPLVHEAADYIDALEVVNAKLVKAAEARVLYGHCLTCSSLHYAGRLCDCGHADLRDALAAAKES